MSRYYTIGHSTHPLAHFIELLRGAGARCVADVRTMPRSRTNPQFNADVLPAALAAADIGYQHIAALGGLRSRRRDVAEDTNAYWENASFHNYADYAMSDAFAGGLARLRELAAKAPTAVMCAEALWWRCHRRIIADYLLAAGEQVAHIMADGTVAEARLTPAARRTGAVLVYPHSA
ncbi:MAG TPA: DUF488 domain-containing protein [Burkholderiales bacterium]|nr:DUF488 domain-containing protein [Burkholderiales bacterium]